MYGLIIKNKWLDLILTQDKTLEVRGHSTKKINQPIYLLESGSNKVRGKCIIRSSMPVTKKNWSELKDKHKIDMTFYELQKRYPTPYYWELGNIEIIDDNITYKHPKGAVIWIKDVEDKFNLL